MRIAVRGAVQGVGFRPFVHRLASEMRLPGWVLNSLQGVLIEVEGERKELEAFLFRLEKEKPAASFIQSLEFSLLDPVGYDGFAIRRSDRHGAQSALILPDIATCAECLSEVMDPGNRRYRYPFTNCTHCGPRFTIMESLPYDRPNTSMRVFRMCLACRHEYEDPADRRFHAQPNACPECGPWLELWDPSGKPLSIKNDALLECAEGIREGKIIALKGLGGFHLIVDARNPLAVETLRQRKRREEKPFALMYPSLEAIQADCEVSLLEARLLASPESPLVLLERKHRRLQRTAADLIAPGNPYLGVMLPYTPLHHLLMQEICFPVVATSGNISDEPICIDEHEALVRLAGIADLFLVHNRPIVRHADDSIVRIACGRELILRRARGYAPLPLQCKQPLARALAVGAHLKNTVAVAIEDNIFVSQHIGDLENKETLEAFQKAIESFRVLYSFDPDHVVADMHPDYLSSRFARACGKPVVSIQHHFAHVAACMAENELNSSVLGVAWDGTGYGPDGTVWGGEFLLTDQTSFTRVASLRRFRLPGIELAVREPRRAALGLLYEMLGESVFEQQDLHSVRSFSGPEITVLAQMLRRGINSPWTSSAGRLFDTVGSILGIRQRIRFEGQAAMELEFAADGAATDDVYPFAITNPESIEPKAEAGRENAWGIPTLFLVDWEPMIRNILRDARSAIPPAQISAKFHNTLAEIIVAVAGCVANERIVLTGGCFQNKYLLERTVHKLEAKGFRPYWHQRVPPNDGGIALGQIVAASRLIEARGAGRQK